MDKSALFPRDRMYYVDSTSPRFAGQFVKPSRGFYVATEEFVTPDYDAEIKFAVVDPATGEQKGALGSYYVNIRYVKLVVKTPVRGVDYELLPGKRTHRGSNTHVKDGALVRYLRDAGDSHFNVRISCSKDDDTSGYSGSNSEAWVARYFLAETADSTAVGITSTTEESKNKLVVRTGQGHTLKLNGPADELVDLDTLGGLIAELTAVHTARLAAAPDQELLTQLRTALDGTSLNGTLTSGQRDAVAKDLYTAGLRKTAGTA